LNIGETDLFINQVLRESLAGDSIFPQHDTIHHGVTIISGTLTYGHCLYYTLTHRSVDLINQQNGSDLFLPLNENAVKFADMVNR
jgi:hypothetical protein